MDAGRSDRIVEESRREAKGVEEDEDEDDYHDDGEEGGGGGCGGDGGSLVGAASVLVHERPVVLQAPVIGRPFMKQAPHFLKTANQQPNKPSSSHASQLHRPDENLKLGTSQAPHSTRVRPTENVTAVDHKSSTLQLGEFCYDLQPWYTHANNYTGTYRM
jgi:hypothetical protein